MASIQLSIADPCHENWDQMLPEEKGRFCLSCQKTVVDFTNMSDGQVFAYFKNYQGNTCGQFSPQQLDRQITKPKTYAIGKWKYFWQLLIPAVFAFHKSNAQTKLKGKVASKVVCKADSSKPVVVRMGLVAPRHFSMPVYEVNGSVVDGTGKAIGYATISTGSRYMVADSMGKFSISLKSNEELRISYVGYESKTLSFDSLIHFISPASVTKGSNTIIIEADILLKQAENNIPGASVIVSGLAGRVGGLTMVRTSRFSRSKVIKPVVEEPALKIFPNPIQPGQDFKVRLQLKKSGNYFVRITDVTGKILTAEERTIEKGQDITISGAVLQKAGIYFLNVLNPADKKDKGLTGKLVVQ